MRRYLFRLLHIPLGTLPLQSVLDANKMVSRVVLYVFVLTARGVFWMLEQPVNSLLEAHPRFQQLIAHFKIYRVKINMGDFGAGSLKPSWIYSNYQEISALPSYGDRRQRGGMALTEEWTNSSGRSCSFYKNPPLTKKLFSNDVLEVI